METCLPQDQTRALQEKEVKYNIYFFYQTFAPVTFTLSYIFPERKRVTVGVGVVFQVRFV